MSLVLFTLWHHREAQSKAPLSDLGFVVRNIHDMQRIEGERTFEKARVGTRELVFTDIQRPEVNKPWVQLREGE